jgi:hypothetical protein
MTRSVLSKRRSVILVPDGHQDVGKDPCRGRMTRSVLSKTRSVILEPVGHQDVGKDPCRGRMTRSVLSDRRSMILEPAGHQRSRMTLHVEMAWSVAAGRPCFYCQLGIKTLADPCIRARQACVVSRTPSLLFRTVLFRTVLFRAVLFRAVGKPWGVFPAVAKARGAWSWGRSRPQGF